MAHKVTYIPGDGIGPEVMEAAIAVIDATGVSIEWEKGEAGAEVEARVGTNLPTSTLEQIIRSHATLKGPTETGVGKGAKSANVALRKSLDLYANLRPVKSIPGVKTRYEDVDLVVVRENTEDLYSGLEHIVVPGVVESIKIITEKASTRIARFAFEHARKHGRKKVTAVHKANIMKLSDGLFLECCRNVSRAYPEIEYTEIIVDNCCLQLVRDPSRFDVLVLENLYGDIVSDLCAGLVGGLGVVPGANIGEVNAVFEAVHGTAPDIAGKGIANPTALLLSAELMLQHLGEMDAAKRLRGAIERVLGEGRVLNPDLGGTATTKEYVEALKAALA
ncbi:isocitrate dehydrogenase (NAD(+)) [Vulgatibacter incomptus]|uniref:Isocitrate dehydrogenase n=1 Tax=Vulgatibacter incomptus TaxID=1391653 RepID=A0A0K1P8E4_9BACT|nr:isocitrate dehydrogenase (NAD(+)) [Vulgatibacter incomptus]AKU89767.1 Isocitrate dehydrogenase [Vulgatibacter incomptus]